MSVAARVLPPAEWPRLAGTLLARVCPTLDPATASIIVVETGETGGAIVACWAVFPLWHLEGCWIDPAYRQTVAVARAGLRAMRAVLQARGIPDVWVMATNPETAAMCEKLGDATALACEHWTVRMKER